MIAAQPAKIRLVQFNVENLFLFMDLYSGQDLRTLPEPAWRKLSTSTALNKSLAKTWALAKAIEDIDPDILCLNEVGGQESLENFNHHFLQDRFLPFLKEGNSHRGIDVGYLVKKNFPLKPFLFSHKDRPLHFLYPHESQAPGGAKSHYFSRDVAELRLFEQDESSPRLVILLTHLKSKLDPDNIDPGGRLRREAELKTLVSLYGEVRTELGPEVPVIVVGDLNGSARTDDMEPEFSSLHSQTDLIETLSAMSFPLEKRFSQLQINNMGKVTPVQIDYVFVSPNLKESLIAASSGVYQFKTELGEPAALPRTMEERDRLPSDHYPIVVDLRWPLPRSR